MSNEEQQEHMNEEEENFLFLPGVPEVDPDDIVEGPILPHRFKSVNQFVRHVVRSARSSSRALALAPTNTVSAQTAILESYRAMYGTFYVTLVIAMIRADGRGGKEKARGIKILRGTEQVQVMGWSVCEEFLQLFGGQIQKLHIAYIDIGEDDYRSVLDMVYNLCIRRSNLIQIEFDNLQKFPIEPFPIEETAKIPHSERYYNRIQNVFLNLGNS